MLQLCLLSNWQITIYAGSVAVVLIDEGIYKDLMAMNWRVVSEFERCHEQSLIATCYH